MRRIIAFIIMLLSFMAVFGISFKIFDKKSEPKVDFSTLTYAVLGDSITYGADYSRDYAQMDRPYCEVVKNILGLKAVKNYGISGSTLSTGVGSEHGMANRSEHFYERRH